MHACDRLAALKFTEVQQREFIKVAMHCLAIVSHHSFTSAHDSPILTRPVPSM